MSTYIVVGIEGAFLGESVTLYFVGQVIQSGGVDIINAVARCTSQTQAQAIANSLNGV